MRKLRPKTGEKREVRQPLKIDRLPQEMRDRICRARECEWKTWEQIEEESPHGPEWEKAAPEARALFPRLRLPHSNLQRWYDLRVDQKRSQVVEEGQKAQVFAEAFAKHEFKDVDKAVINALAREAFSVMKAADDPKAHDKFFSALNDFGYVLSKLKKVQLDKDKLDFERERLEARQQNKNDFDARELYLAAAQDVLKKLRTRKAVREVIDPIREELIAEFAHGAEAYANSIEARTA